MKNLLERFRAGWTAFWNPEIIKQKVVIKKVEANDELTGALTRRSFFSAVRRESARAQRRGESMSLVFIDLDKLGIVNDVCKHDGGDEYIRELSRAIKQELRSFEFFVRWGGDEFIILLSATEAIAENVVCRIKTTFPMFSHGIAEFHSYSKLEKTIELADKRMYAQKNAKKIGGKLITVKC